MIQRTVVNSIGVPNLIYYKRIININCLCMKVNFSDDTFNGIIFNCDNNICIFDGKNDLTCFIRKNIVDLSGKFSIQLFSSTDLKISRSATFNPSLILTIYSSILLSPMCFSKFSSYCANSHFLRPAGPHFPASQGHIKRPVLEIGRAERGLRPANQYRALSQKAMLSQSVR